MTKAIKILFGVGLLLGAIYLFAVPNVPKWGVPVYVACWPILILVNRWLKGKFIKKR